MHVQGLIIPPFFSDLCHVDLLPEHYDDPSTHTIHPPLSELCQSMSMPAGSALSPVPTHLIEKIKSGAFIEMGDLSSNGLDDAARLKLRCSVTNISEWLQAFAVHVSVIARKQPHRVLDLMGYQILILEASNEYHNDCWLGYDRHFCQQATSQPHCKWSNVHSTLWNMAFTGQARTDQCSYCFSLFHHSRECELR